MHFAVDDDSECKKKIIDKNGFLMECCVGFCENWIEKAGTEFIVKCVNDLSLTFETVLYILDYFLH